MKAIVCLLSALPLLAAVDGTVTNRTTGKPQPGATVTIYKLGESGMESLESVKSDAAGKFTMETTPGAGPYLIQAAYDGVTYNKMLTPNSPRTGVEVEVFNSQAKPGDAKISQHMLLFEPVEGKLMVNENIIYQNAGTMTYNDPSGTLRFYLPPEAQGKVRVTGSAPNGMPVERAAVPTKASNVFGVDFPIKPGETRFQLTYELPFAAPGNFTGKILHKDGTTRLVTPRGVTLKGDGVTELGREPATQAAIYNLTAQDYSVEITGTGSLREPSGGSSGDEGPGLQEILPRIYDRVYIVLGLVAAILGLGFALLYRSSGSTQQMTPAAPAKGKRHG